MVFPETEFLTEASSSCQILEGVLLSPRDYGESLFWLPSPVWWPNRETQSSAGDRSVLPGLPRTHILEQAAHPGGIHPQKFTLFHHQSHTFPVYLRIPAPAVPGLRGGGSSSVCAGSGVEVSVHLDLCSPDYAAECGPLEGVGRPSPVYGLPSIGRVNESGWLPQTFPYALNAVSWSSLIWPFSCVQCY